jgi:hypothetical protein
MREEEGKGNGKFAIPRATLPSARATPIDSSQYFVHSRKKFISHKGHFAADLYKNVIAGRFETGPNVWLLFSDSVI